MQEALLQAESHTQSASCVRLNPASCTQLVQLAVSVSQVALTDD